MAVLGHVLRKARRFIQQPRFVRAWFLPVWLLLAVSKVLIFTIPFQRLAPQLGARAGVAPWVPLLTSDQPHRARLTARYTFWNANCFPQAITARWLLGLYDVPYVFFFGLSRDASDAAGMKAHAWVVAGPVRVTGGYSFHQFTEVRQLIRKNGYFQGVY